MSIHRTRSLGHLLCWLRFVFTCPSNLPGFLGVSSRHLGISQCVHLPLALGLSVQPSSVQEEQTALEMLRVSPRCCEGGSRDAGGAASMVGCSDGVHPPHSPALLGSPQPQPCPLALPLPPVPGPARRQLSPLAPGLTLLPPPLSASPAAPGAGRALLSAGCASPGHGSGGTRRGCRVSGGLSPVLRPGPAPHRSPQRRQRPALG